MREKAGGGKGAEAVPCGVGGQCESWWARLH